jgi:hypothetical protein
VEGLVLALFGRAIIGLARATSSPASDAMLATAQIADDARTWTRATNSVSRLLRRNDRVAAFDA